MYNKTVFCYFFQEYVNQTCGLPGDDSPLKNATGTIVLPQTDIYGCEGAVYSNTENYSSWIALVARGKCFFSTKIIQVPFPKQFAFVLYNTIIFYLSLFK